MGFLSELVSKSEVANMNMMFGNLKPTPPNYPSLIFTSTNPHPQLMLLNSPRKKIASCYNSHSFNNGVSPLKFVRGKKQLRELTSWGIGGTCNYFIQVFHQTHLLSALRFCNENSIKFMIIGRGSNCLFDDLGFDGCIILNRIEFMERIEAGVYRVGSGFRFNHLGVKCSNEGFTGLEFAGGIPGTVGGAVYMNAGANGQEVADTIDTVEIITIYGKLLIMKQSELSFEYRHSPFQNMDDLAAIVAVTFRLKCSDSARRKQLEFLLRRKLTQPVGEKTAGSVFRNPCNSAFSAGELIEKAGLKGFQVGGAMVSEKHANFFKNCGNASSQDMLELIRLVKETVYNKFDVELKEEIMYINPYSNH